MNDQPHISRWKERLSISLLLVVAFFVIFPTFICGCHFHPEALVVNLVPVAWGFYALVTYRGRGERIVGWVAFAFAAFSAWMGFEANLMFAFT